MKKYLLPESGNFYKANIHCHTNISDGTMTPEEVKAHYMAHGYSVVAFTDHDVMLNQSHLTDSDFLALNGFEAEINEKGRPLGNDHKTCHLCFVAKEPDNLTMPFYHRTKYMIGNGHWYRDQIQFDDSQPDHEREYTAECINGMIRMGKEAGFFVTYNHPVWSQESYPDYMRYEGMDAMEILNFSSWNAGFTDYNPRVYDDMLRGGKRLYAVAADDNHGTADACGGWIMVKAEKLDYKAITEALEKGHFYASAGPEIHELWFDGGYIHVKCSAAARIVCNYGFRRARCVEAEDGGSVTEAIFDVSPSCAYCWITVVDAQGRAANTNAFFVEDLQ